MKVNLKHISILIFFLNLISWPLIAQSIQPKEGHVMHDDKSRPCLVVQVDPETKTLKKAWKNYLKDNYDIKLSGIGFLTNKSLLTAEKVVIEKISPKSIDFYTRITEDENGSKMQVFIAFGYDIYLDPKQHPQSFEAMESILFNFLDTYLPVYYQGRIDDTADRIKDLKKEGNKLEKEIKKDSKEIASLEKKIEKLKEHLEVNRTELMEANRKISAREEKLKRINKQLER